jgi:hypothetical protein
MCREMQLQHPAFTPEFAQLVSPEERAALARRIAAHAPVPGEDAAVRGLMAVQAPLPEHMELLIKALDVELV